MNPPVGAPHCVASTRKSYMNERHVYVMSLKRMPFSGIMCEQLIISLNAGNLFKMNT